MSIQRPAGRAIHDLAHLAGLSDIPDNVLLLSSRSLYVLQNLVALEAVRQSRYAVEVFDNGRYQAVEEWDAQFPLYKSTVEGLELEVMTMPDVLSYLQNISDRLDAMGVPYAHETALYAQATKVATGAIEELTVSLPGDPERAEVQLIYAGNLARQMTGCVFYIDNGTGVYVLASGQFVAGQDYTWSEQAISVGQGAVIRVLMFGNQSGDTLLLRVLGVELR